MRRISMDHRVKPGGDEMRDAGQGEQRVGRVSVTPYRCMAYDTYHGAIFGAGYWRKGKRIYEQQNH
jgi:hypothetical protein